MAEYKGLLEEYSKAKQECMFVNKRDRQIKNGWRDGMLGVEHVGDKGSEFYGKRYEALAKT